MNKRTVVKLILALVATGFFVNSWATPYNNTMSVLSASLSIIFWLCEITGLMFIGISFVRYQQYRQNPSETPLSRVIYVLLFGLAMLIFPYIAGKATIHNTMEQAADAAVPNPNPNPTPSIM